MTEESIQFFHLRCPQTNFRRHDWEVEWYRFPTQGKKNSRLYVRKYDMKISCTVIGSIDYYYSKTIYSDRTYFETQFARIFRIKIVQCSAARPGWFLLGHWCLSWRAHWWRQWWSWNHNTTKLGNQIYDSHIFKKVFETYYWLRLTALHMQN